MINNNILRFFLWIGNPRWPPPLDKVLAYEEIFLEFLFSEAASVPFESKLGCNIP